MTIKATTKRKQRTPTPRVPPPPDPSGRRPDFWMTVERDSEPFMRIVVDADEPKESTK